jgi:RNA-directed DNA polymerase
MDTRESQHWLRYLFEKIGQKPSGFYAYFGISGNARALDMLYQEAILSLMKYLNRRSQRRSYTWATFKQLLTEYPLPLPRLLKKTDEQLSFIYELY